MKIAILCVLTVFLAGQAWAQDSLGVFLKIDSLGQLQTDSLQRSIARADSILATFQTQADSIQTAFQTQASKIESSRIRLQTRLDSLNALKLPTQQITAQLDSLTRSQSEQLTQLTSKLETLKSKTTQHLDQVTLPQQLQEPLDKLKASVNSYSLPALALSAGKLSEVSLPTLNLKIPTLTQQINLDPNLKDLTTQLPELHQWTDKAGAYAQDVKNLSQGKLDDVKHLDKTLEQKLSGMEGVDQLAEGKALLSEYSQMDSAAFKAKAKELVQEQVMTLAQDHFADKKEVLQAAMDKMSKLKSKYSEVKSLAELPKRAPNPLKGKPLIERLLPGLSFQIQKSNYFLLDVNPTLVYRIRPRIHAGVGWNQRLPWDGWDLKTDEMIYGPRAILEVKWTKGINFRLLPELMNTTVPPKIASSMGLDPANREWVPSLFVGIKKDFTVYKTIQGFTEVLYNLYDQDGKSPYIDRLNVRFGFEFPMKKKAKQ